MGVFQPTVFQHNAFQIGAIIETLVALDATLPGGYTASGTVTISGWPTRPANGLPRGSVIINISAASSGAARIRVA